MTSQEGRFLNFHKPLMTSGLLLMKNLLTPLAKNNLVPLGLTTAAPAKDKAIQKKTFESGTTTLVFRIKDLNNIMRLAKSLEESGLLIKGVCGRIKNETKEQKGGLLSLTLDTLVDSFLGIFLAGKGVIRGGDRVV